MTPKRQRTQKVKMRKEVTELLVLKEMMKKTNDKPLTEVDLTPHHVNVG